MRSFLYFARKVTCNYSRRGFALKCDIRKFFDSIDHDVLISIVRKKVSDEKFLSLVIQIINSFSAVNGKGLPLGNVTSQILANVYFNEFDQYIKYILKMKYYIRYCDDFVLLDTFKQTLTSYAGMLGHCKSWKVKRLLRKTILSNNDQCV